MRRMFSRVLACLLRAVGPTLTGDPTWPQEGAFLSQGDSRCTAIDRWHGNRSVGGMLRPRDRSDVGRQLAYILKSVFEWDPAKATANLAKHEVSFDEAETTFNDPCAVEAPDLANSATEPRFRRIGRSAASAIFMVV